MIVLWDIIILIPFAVCSLSENKIWQDMLTVIIATVYIH